MRKEFRFMLDIAVELKEAEEASPARNENERLTRLLLDEFIKDDRAVLDFFKLWIIENFRSDYQYNTLKKYLCPRDEDAILKSVLKKTSPDVQEYFNGILDSPDMDRLEDLENFYQGLEHIKFTKAGFKEINKRGQ